MRSCISSHIINIINVKHLINFIKLMKQIIQAKAQPLDKQQMFLPQLRTKSMSIPSSKFHINYASRYQDRKSRGSIMRSRDSFDKNCIINLEQIQKKAHDHQNKVQNHSERKKILSQYQTVDLWKEKYCLNQQPLFINRKNFKVDPQQFMQAKQRQIKQSKKNEIERSIEEQKIFQLKRTNKQNSIQLKLKRKQDRGRDKQMEIPDEVVVSKINEYQRLRKDDKLEIILKKQVRQDEPHMKKSYKSSLPVFQKVIPQTVAPLSSKQKEDEQNPSQWQYSNHYAEQQDHF